MTQKELDKYIKLQDKFQLRCEAICEILKPLNSSYGYLCDFEIDGDKVYGEGDEYWQYGGHEHHSASFPLSCICMSDNKIKEYVDEKIRKKVEARLAEQVRMKEFYAMTFEKQEREEYERLKKKFEGE